MKNVRKSKVIIMAFLYLLTILILIGCNNDDDIPPTQSSEDQVEVDVNSIEQSISEYTSEIESLQTQNEFLNEQNQYFVNVIKRLLEDFSDEEILEFSQNQFIYELQVNGESIPKSGQIAISSGGVEILLSEKGLGYEFLDAEWLEKGKISGNYIDHISINFDTTNWTPLGTDGTVNTAQGYKATNVKPGERISFTITDELKERLNLDTNLIQIEVS